MLIKSMGVIYPVSLAGTVEAASQGPEALLKHFQDALTMSRIVDDPALSEKILEVARKRIADVIDLPTSMPRAKRSRARSA